MTAQQLATKHDGLAHRAAYRFRKSGAYWGVEPDDLLQAARAGLLTACQRFDQSRGTKASCYLYPYIEEFVRREIGRYHPAGYSRGCIAYARRKGRPIMCPATVSLHDPGPGGGSEPIELLLDERDDNPEEAARREEEEHVHVS